MHHFFVPAEAVKGQRIVITGPDVNHIKNALRMKTGENLRITAEPEQDFTCRILSIEEKLVEAEILSREESRELPMRLYLFQGLPKGDKMEWIIQKAVELGVFEIIPVSTQNTVVKLDAKKEKTRVERWQAIAESAAKQSGRSRIPKVSRVMGFEEALQAAALLDRAWIPYEKEDGMEGTRRELASLSAQVSSLGIFIGPEGGFDLQEIRRARETGVCPVSLGKRILRTETAGLAVLSLLMMKAEGAF